MSEKVWKMREAIFIAYKFLALQQVNEILKFIAI